LTPEKVLGRLGGWIAEGFLPAAGDRGLDFTPSWGRTYWGGALFCLLADIEIRNAPEIAKAWKTHCRAVLAAGGQLKRNGR